MLQFLPWVHLACAIVVTLALAFVVILEWRTYLETKRTLGNLLGAAALFLGGFAGLRQRSTFLQVEARAIRAAELARANGVDRATVLALHEGLGLELDDAARSAIAASAAVVQRAAAGKDPVYGVNTGFGKLASTRIAAADLDTLQRNLIRSHSVGVGAPLAAPVLRLMLALMA